MKRLICFSLLILASLQTTAAPVTLTFGPPLDAAIVDAYIPPTRSDDPYVATEHAVFRWDAESESWISIYQLPWAHSQILQIDGYDKNSNVLYVVHSAGVARTGDVGSSWTESVPSGFPETPTNNVAVAINPAERKHAIITAGNTAWETTDYGITWTQLHPFESMITGVGFIRIPESVAKAQVYITSGSTLSEYKGIPLQRTGQWQADGTPIAALHAHPVKPVIFLEVTNQAWTIATPPLDETFLSTKPMTVHGDRVIPNRAGASSLWTTSSSTISLVSLLPERPPPHQVLITPEPVARLYPHPDDQDGLYWFSGNQLYRLDNGFEGMDPAFIRPAAPPQKSALQWTALLSESVAVAKNSLAQSTAESGDLEQQFAKLAAAQPPFPLVLRKAVAFALGQPADFVKWERQARWRHWLPELRIEGGYRERNTDDHTIIERVDQFGIPQYPEDLNLPDRIRTLGYGAVVLQWDLFDILFDDEQVSIHRERRYTYEQRKELIEELSELYHTRLEKIAEKEGLFGQPSPQRQLRLSMEINQLTEILNGYCGEVVF